MIVMPEDMSEARRHLLKAYGAEVVLTGSSYAEAAVAAKELVEREGRTMVHAFNDPYVIAGQGTIGLEILDASRHVTDVENVRFEVA